jgi:hypothetical protein
MVRLLYVVFAFLVGANAPSTRLPTEPTPPTTTTEPQETLNAIQIYATTTTTTTTTQAPPRERNDWPQEWLATLETPPDSYWDKVAQCETKGDWQDKGQFAGGLGIYYRTWVGWGGEEFAPKQWLATREEQIIVANRIALHGWLAPSGFFQQPVGFLGWGCIRNNEYLKPPVNSPWRAWRTK